MPRQHLKFKPLTRALFRAKSPSDGIGKARARGLFKCAFSALVDWQAM
jgi:hypothetical protein